MASRHNLPRELTSFVGREREIAELERLIATAPLITLTGPGGGGKTRLATRLAATLAESDLFPDGIFFVSLVSVSDPELVIPTIARAFEVKESGGKSLADALADFVTDRSILLLLDNFEQVVTAAPLLSDLLTKCPSVKMLVTSREVLHLYGEHDYPVPPLSLPGSNQLPDLDALSQYEAVALFMQRAHAVNPNFQLTSQNAHSVAEICLRLDGLPLAIELAAARILVLPPEELLARLDSRLKLLTGGARNLPERQRTLRATIDWSYNLLNPDEQTLFKRVGVFVDGCTIDAIEEVCGSNLNIDILDGVTSLVGKSLLQRQDTTSGEPRFNMLETIREYAWQKLDQTAEGEQLRERHADYFLKLAEEATPKLRGPHPNLLLDKLEEDQNNFRAALEWSLTPNGPGAEQRTEKGLRLAGALVEYWNDRGYFSEGRQWYTLLLGRSEPLGSSAERAKALRALAHMTWQLGDVSEARPNYERSLEMFRALGEDRGLARASFGLGNLVMWLGEHDLSLSLFEECVAIAKKLGDRHSIANGLTMIGVILMRKREYQAARPLMDEAAAIARELGDDGLKADLLNMVKRGSLAIHFEEYERARALIEEGLGKARELGIDWVVPYSLGRLGLITLRRGDAHEAETYFLEGLASVRTSGMRRWSRWYMVGLAEVARLRGMVERAAKLIGASEGVLSAVGAQYEPATTDEIARIITDVSAELDETTFARLRAEGRAMSLDEAMAYAAEPMHSAAASPEQRESPLSVPEDEWTNPDDLTEREVEVLRLIAGGKSNQEIGQELVLSRRTVERHISNIYLKIGASGKVARATATAYAHRRGLAT